MSEAKQPKTEPRIPPGVVGVVVDAEGRAIASATDFYPDRPGGCALWEGQEQRLRQTLKAKTLDAYCSPVVAHALDAYTIGQVFDQVKRKHGLRIHYVAVGHRPDAQVYFDHRNRDR